MNLPLLRCPQTLSTAEILALTAHRGRTLTVEDAVRLPWEDLSPSVRVRQGELLFAALACSRDPKLDRRVYCQGVQRAMIRLLADPEVHLAACHLAEQRVKEDLPGFRLDVDSILPQLQDVVLTRPYRSKLTCPDEVLRVLLVLHGYLGEAGLYHAFLVTGTAPLVARPDLRDANAALSLLLHDHALRLALARGEPRFHYAVYNPDATERNFGQNLPFGKTAMLRFKPWCLPVLRPKGSGVFPSVPLRSVSPNLSLTPHLLTLTDPVWLSAVNRSGLLTFDNPERSSLNDYYPFLLYQWWFQALCGTHLDPARTGHTFTFLTSLGNYGMFLSRQRLTYPMQEHFHNVVRPALGWERIELHCLDVMPGYKCSLPLSNLQVRWVSMPDALVPVVSPKTTAPKDRHEWDLLQRRLLGEAVDKKRPVWTLTLIKWRKGFPTPHGPQVLIWKAVGDQLCRDSLGSLLPTHFDISATGGRGLAGRWLVLTLTNCHIRKVPAILLTAYPLCPTLKLDSPWTAVDLGLRLSGVWMMRVLVLAASKGNGSDRRERWL